MLEPQSRRHLMEALRPPEGYELDRAIGTTFSLDLLALLIAPLSFTVFGWEGEDGATKDPLAVFEGLRRYSDRISVYCQAGQIAVPATSQLLFAYLEKSVIEVTPKKPGHVFHPKVWALRLVSEDRPVMYRLLVLSRNLTYDRSWDTVLVLEGEVSEKRRGGVIHPSLGDFFGELPSLAVRDVPERARTAARTVRDEIRRTHFAPPQGFEGLSFWPLGMSSKDQWPFEGRADRMLCVSPFVSKSLLEKLPGRSDGVLVSRREELDALPSGSSDLFESAYSLRDEAEIEDEGPEEADDNGRAGFSGGPVSEDEEGETLRGLHAKLYVADAGWNARLWTGSANATRAAYKGNVEFLVELSGKKSFCGVDRVLGESGGEPGFLDLLQRYEPPSEPVETDELRAALESRADALRREMLELSLAVNVSERSGGDLYDVSLLSGDGEGEVEIPEGVSVRCWPVTLRRDRATEIRDLSAPSVAEFELSLEAITPFFAFEVTATEGESGFSRRFCLNLPLSGLPEGRDEAVIHRLLSSRERVMRLIFMLLAGGSPDGRQLALLLGRGGGTTDGANGGGRDLEIPLFEELVRALWSNPSALDRIDEMLASLRKSESERELIPEELDEIWPEIMQARRMTAGGGKR